MNKVNIFFPTYDLIKKGKKGLSGVSGIYKINAPDVIKKAKIFFRPTSTYLKNSKILFT